MDETIPYENNNVRIIGDKSGQPQALVITSNEGSSIDKKTVQDITTGAARTMDADVGKLPVYAQQSDGSFNQHDMNLVRPHRNIEARQDRYAEEKNMSQLEVDKQISSIKERETGASFSQSADQNRQEYLNEQKK